MTLTGVTSSRARMVDEEGAARAEETPRARVVATVAVFMLLINERLNRTVGKKTTRKEWRETSRENSRYNESKKRTNGREWKREREREGWRREKGRNEAKEREKKKRRDVRGMYCITGGGIVTDGSDRPLGKGSGGW